MARSQGLKEQQIRDLRDAGKLPRHVDAMIADGCPPDLVRLPVCTTVSSETIRRTGSLSARVNIEAQREIDAGAPNFIGYAAPAYAVACPVCKANVGVPCKRPSGHKAMTFHKERGEEADRLWLLHDLPTITAHPDGTFTYDGPETRPSVAGPDSGLSGTTRETSMSTATKTKTTKRPKPKASTERRKPAKARGEKTESKADIVERLLGSKNGATRKQLSDATGFPSVNLRLAGARAEKTVIQNEDRFRLAAGVDLEEAEKEGWKKVF